MAFSKLYDTHAAAVADIQNGSTILVGGVSRAGEPGGLLAALLMQGATDLTVVCDFSGWDGSESILKLTAAGRIARVISPYPFLGATGGAIPQLWDVADIEIDSIPQGTLAERLRSAGAGIGGVFVSVGLATRFSTEKETRTINGVECVLEFPLRADFALLRALAADHLGNLVYSGAQRGWNSLMATSAGITVVEADNVGKPGTIDPELVITPGIYVNRIVQTVGIPTS